MTRLFVSCHQLLARHRPAVVATLLLFTLGVLWLAARLKINTDFTDMLPLSDPTVRAQYQALRQFPQAERLFIDVGTATGDQDALFAAADELHAGLVAIPELEQVRYRFDEVRAEEFLGDLVSQLPGLLRSNELAEVERRLSAPAIEARLRWFHDTLSQAQGPLLKAALRSDPLGIADPVLQRLEQLRAGSGGGRLESGRLLNADGRHLLITALPRFASSDHRRNETLLARVLAAARKVEQAHADNGTHVAVTGAHRVSLDNANLIIGDAWRAATLALALFCGLLLMVYRRRRFALLTLTPTLFGGLGALGVLAITGDSFSALALGCGSILIGISDDYANHIFYHLDDTPVSDRAGLATAVAGLVPPLTVAALTTIAGFLILLFSPVAGHRQVGVFAASGIGLAAVFAVLAMPLFVPVHSAGAVRPLPLTRIIERIYQWRERHWTAVLAVAVLLTVASLAAVRGLRFEGDLSRLNGLSAEARQDEALIREVWGQALSLTTVLVTAPTRESALEKNERVLATLESLRSKSAGVKSYSSVAPLLPSPATRQANARAWQRTWTAERVAGVSNALTQAAATLGLRDGLFTPFLGSLASAGQEAGPRDGMPDVLASLTRDHVQETAGVTVLTTLVKTATRADDELLRRAMMAAVPGAVVFSKAEFSDAIARVARGGLLRFALIVAVANAFVLLLLLGRIDLVLMTLMPISLGILWTLGALRVFGGSINVSNFIFVVFVVGVGIDYSMFLINAKLAPVRGEPEHAASAGGSVTVCALTTLIGFGVLVLARHPALFSVGLTALLGISFSLAATLLLVPPGMDLLLRQAGAHQAGRAQSPAGRRREIRRRYRYQGMYVEQFVFWKLRTDPVFGVLDEVVPPWGRVLDLGCGYGLTAHWLTEAAPARCVIGFDMDETKLAVARATAVHAAGVTFEHSDLLTDSDYPSCETVLLLDVLHYFPHDLKLVILRKAAAALARGGRLIIRDGFRTATRAHRVVVCFERWAVWIGHNRTRHGLHFEDRENHEALLREAGFEQIEIRDDAGLGSNRMLVATRSG